MLKIKSHFSGFLYLVLECYTSRIVEKNNFFFDYFFMQNGHRWIEFKQNSEYNYKDITQQDLRI